MNADSADLRGSGRGMRKESRPKNLFQKVKDFRFSSTERHSRKLVLLAFSLRPSRLRGESAVPHSPPRRKEREESANKNSFQAAKVSSTDILPVKIGQIRVNPCPIAGCTRANARNRKHDQGLDTYPLAPAGAWRGGPTPLRNANDRDFDAGFNPLFPHPCLSCRPRVDS